MRGWRRLGFEYSRLVCLFGFLVEVPEGMSEELFEHFVWALGRVDEE